MNRDVIERQFANEVAKKLSQQKSINSIDPAGIKDIQYSWKDLILNSD